MTMCNKMVIVNKESGEVRKIPIDIPENDGEHDYIEAQMIEFYNAAMKAAGLSWDDWDFEDIV